MDDSMYSAATFATYPIWSRYPLDLFDLSPGIRGWKECTKVDIYPRYRRRVSQECGAGNAFEKERPHAINSWKTKFSTQLEDANSCAVLQSAMWVLRQAFKRRRQELDWR